LEAVFESIEMTWGALEDRMLFLRIKQGLAARELTAVMLDFLGCGFRRFVTSLKSAVDVLVLMSTLRRRLSMTIL
jgi:hypothetical protein